MIFFNFFVVHTIKCCCCFSLHKFMLLRPVFRLYMCTYERTCVCILDWIVLGVFHSSASVVVIVSAVVCVYVCVCVYVYLVRHRQRHPNARSMLKTYYCTVSVSPTLCRCTYISNVYEWLHLFVGKFSVSAIGGNLSIKKVFLIYSFVWVQFIACTQTLAHTYMPHIAIRNTEQRQRR